MISIDPAWEGAVQFYELVYGIWLSYIFLVLMWEKVLRVSLDEWRYVMANFLGAGAFWVNHYFQFSDFWFTLINVYTLGFLIVWYLICVKPSGKSMGKSALWQAGAMAGAIVYTFAFIGFENIARYGVDTLGYSEFWFMLASYIGFIAIILWRGTRRAA